jgi:hypothetical protein
MNIVHKKKDTKKSTFKKERKKRKGLFSLYRTSAQNRKRKLLHKNRRK